jgi:hypothetical protein
MKLTLTIPAAEVAYAGLPDDGQLNELATRAGIPLKGVWRRKGDVYYCEVA